MDKFEIWFKSIATFALVLTATVLVWRIAQRKLRGISSLGAEIAQNFVGPVRLLSLVIAIRAGLEFHPDLANKAQFVNTVVKLVVVVLAVWLIERLTTLFVKSARFLGTVSVSARALIVNVIRFLVLAIGVLIALDTVGISITPLLASLGVGSVAVALALQDTLSNLFSGVYIMLDKPFRIGDSIRLEEGVEGTVLSIGWRSTQIRTNANNVTVIPNSKLSGSTILNFDLIESDFVFFVEVGVGYESELPRVEQVAIQCARNVLQRTEGGVAEFLPYVRFISFGDSAINLRLFLKARTWADHFLVKHEMIKALHETFYRERIEIPFPQRVVQMKQVPPQL